jgi:hypothetical protein
MSKVYIMGKVTGIDYEECCDLFNTRQLELEKKGHTVVNPTEIVPPGSSWTEAMKICIEALLGCEAYNELPNAAFSRGAFLEKSIAREMKLIEILN